MGYTLIGILMVLGPALYAMAGVFGARKLLHGRVQEGHNDVLVPIFLTAGVLYAVLLGFMVIAVWESYDAAEDNAANEAAELVPLYRTTSALPPEVGGHMRDLAREYAKAVIEDEWVTQAETGKGSPKARKASGDMFRAFGDGTINADIKKNYPFICAALMLAINEVSTTRNKRNIQANKSVPLAMWIVAMGAGLVITTLSFFLFMERGLPHMLMSAAMASLIGFLLFVCLMLSHPFSGPLEIQPEAFENVLHVFDGIDQGN